MSACSWSKASPSLGSERVFWARVCACVRGFQRGSSVWEGKKHDTCFCQSADCSALQQPPLPPAALPFLSSPSCLTRSRDQSRFPLLLPGIQAQTCRQLLPTVWKPFILQSSTPRRPLLHVHPPPPFLTIQPPGGLTGGEVSAWLAPANGRQEMRSSLDSSPFAAAL